MLVTTRHENALRAVWLEVHPVMIGRAPACDIVLDDPDVADSHVRLSALDGALVVENLAAPITVDGISLATNASMSVEERRPICVGRTTITAQLQRPIVVTREGADHYPTYPVNPPRPAEPEPRGAPPRLRPRKDILSTNATEQQLLEALRAAPGDASTRMVYADWLDERSFKAKFELLQNREHLGTFIHRKATTVDWRAVAVRTPIEYCGASTCPLYWDELVPTDATDFARTCSACRQLVAYCGDLHDVLAAAHHEMRIVVDAAVDPPAARQTYTRRELPPSVPRDRGDDAG